MKTNIIDSLSLDFKKQIIKYYLEPHSAKNTAKKFNLKYDYNVKKILKEFNIELPGCCRKFLCEYCNRLVSLNSKKRHLKAHKDGKSIYFLKSHQSVSHEGLICIYCGKECKNKNSLAQHECRCKNNPNRYMISNSKHKHKCNIPLDKRGWSKGLTAKTDERVARATKKMKEYYLDPNHHGAFLGKKHSEETKEKIRQKALQNTTERHFGHHKIYSYKDFTFFSSYEFKVAQSLDNNNIRWVQPKRLKYIDNKNKLHYYTADFYLPDYDIYLDPKNDFLINNENPILGYKDIDKIKWVMEQNNVKILVLNKNQLTWNEINKLIKNNT